jgi:GR25 family glycosyltransferase involved in LPS biosynthesis
MFNEIKKYVINLKKRPERLELVKKEFDYIGYDVEVFEGIDLGSHVGCAKSHLEIIKLAMRDNLESVVVFEDDIIFMPYAKSLLDDISLDLKNIYYGALNFNPSIHRPLNISNESSLLLDITNKPPKQEKHRGVFGTGFMIYHKSVYESMLDYDNHMVIAIDEFLENKIYSKYQSYSPILPICAQYNNESDVSGGFYNNFYTQTYNWNEYCPNKIPPTFYDQSKVLSLKENGDMDYKTILR